MDSSYHLSLAAISENVFNPELDSLFFDEIDSDNTYYPKRYLVCSQQTTTVRKNWKECQSSTGLVMIVLDSYDKKHKHKHKL